MQTLVSVVITTFQRKEEFKRALLSVTKQSYKGIEIIVVDDNVESEYSKFVKGYIDELKDERIIYVKNKENLGGALSRNVGIEKSKCNYVAFLDDDDYYLPKKVEMQLAMFKELDDDKLALVYCYCDEIQNGKVSMRYRYNYVGSFLYEAMLRCVAATSQWMCRKSCLEKVGCFTNMPCKQDSYVILKLLAHGYNLNRVPEVLSIYDNNDRPKISSKSARKRIEGETKLRELCRANYDKLTTAQQDNVEYSFACILAPYYYETGDRKMLADSLRIIMQRPFSGQTIRVRKILLKKKAKRMFASMK